MTSCGTPFAILFIIISASIVYYLNNTSFLANFSVKFHG